MWQWDQSAGELSREGKVVAKGYAGHDWGKNNPDAQAVRGIGPVPRGLWGIQPPRDSSGLGPYVLNLLPQKGTVTHGRSLFRIHGDSAKMPGKASHGCIIVPRVARMAIWESGDHVIVVVE